MKFLKSLVFVTAIAMAAASFAQEAKPEEKAPEKPKLKISGLGYLEWSKELKHSSTTQTENNNTFSIKRVYLDFQKKLDDMWSVRATTDVGQVESKSSKKYTETGTTTSTVESKTNSYSLFLKYAYVEAKQKFDFASYKFQFGLIGTPLIGFVDKQSDYRWLEQNYADQAKTVIGTSIDHSADLGVSMEISLFQKLLTLTGSITNGEGYKVADEVKLGDDGKAYYGMATVMPIDNAYLFGIYRYQDTNDMISKNYNKYMGAGIAYSDELFKLGAMYLIPETSSKTTSSPTVTENKYKLFDSWVNVRLDTIISMPVIVVGRYAFGENEDATKSKITVWATGLGYQIADGLRATVYYQNSKAESKDDPDVNVFVKTEVKF
ncbi:MAG: hypothetical protein WBK20_08195 [Spirochaetota bacterium]